MWIRITSKQNRRSTVMTVLHQCSKYFTNRLIIFIWHNTDANYDISASFVRYSTYFYWDLITVPFLISLIFLLTSQWLVLKLFCIHGKSFLPIIHFGMSHSRYFPASQLRDQTYTPILKNSKFCRQIWQTTFKKIESQEFNEQCFCGSSMCFFRDLIDIHEISGCDSNDISINWKLKHDFNDS